MGSVAVSPGCQVLPYVALDLVSYSSYDTMASPEYFPQGVWVCARCAIMQVQLVACLLSSMVFSHCAFVNSTLPAFE